MINKKDYNRIKQCVFKKFDALEVTERINGHLLYLHYKSDEYSAEMLIVKSQGSVYYTLPFKQKICKYIPLEQFDFEVILKEWAEHTFQMKVYDMSIFFWE